MRVIPSKIIFDPPSIDYVEVESEAITDENYLCVICSKFVDSEYIVWYEYNLICEDCYDRYVENGE